MKLGRCDRTVTLEGEMQRKRKRTRQYRKTIRSMIVRLKITVKLKNTIKSVQLNKKLKDNENR